MNKRQSSSKKSKKKEGVTKIYNSNLKRKSVSAVNEISVNHDKIDSDVNELWVKFVIYYDYENIFNINNLNSSLRESIQKKKGNVDFNLKLQTLFNNYKIRKADDYNLVSNSEAGSYLLNSTEIWCMYIKTLIEKNNFKFKNLFEIFNFALEYQIDEHLLFDFFMEITLEYEEEEILEFNEKIIPYKFVEIYNKNREHILKTLQEDNNIEDCNDNITNEEFIKILNNEKSVEIDPCSKEGEPSIVQNQMSFGDGTIETKIIPEELDFSFNKDIKINVKEIININDVSSDDNQGMDNLKLESDQNNNTEKKGEEKNQNLIESPEIVPPPTPSKSQFEIKEKILIKFYEKNKKNNPITEYKTLKKISKEDDLEEAYIVDSNIRNSGNFAILELTGKSKEKVGHKFVLTPLKETYQEALERAEADKDLEEIRKKYPDFIYNPFDVEIKNKIQDTTNKKTKRLSFCDSNYNIHLENK